MVRLGLVAELAELAAVGRLAGPRGPELAGASRVRPGNVPRPGTGGRRFRPELRKAAWDTESFGENALGDLRSILEDALARIKDEVFGGTTAKDSEPESGPGQAPNQNPERNDSNSS
jgi:hypothetical protein